jgi:hypothetical protein
MTRFRALVLAGAAAAAAVGCGPAQEPAAPRPKQTSAPERQVALVRWDYRPDPRDVGLRRGWESGRFVARPVSVPHVADPGPVSGAAGRRAYAGSVGWYRRKIVVRGGVYALRFSSAQYAATVWIDGARAAFHTGAYEAFAARTQLRRGPHLVVVRVDWRAPAAQRAAGWARGWFNFGGLNRPVTLAPIGRAEIGALRLQTRLPRPGTARIGIQARVRNDAQPRTVRVVGLLARGGRRVRFAFAPVHLGTRQSATVHRTIIVSGAALWSPRRPALWDLTLAVPGDASVRRRVGLRELEWGPRGLRINGRPLVLAGASIPPDARGHGDAFTRADIDRIVAELHAIGANATRAQQPLPAELLDRLDAAGILVWQEVGPWDPAAAWSAQTPQLRARATQRLQRTVDAEQTHPSVAVWSLGNEVAGQGHPGGQAEWIDASASLLHRIDPGRPVAVDLWGPHLPHAAELLTRRLDVLGLTDYTGWYELAGAPPAVQARQVEQRLARLGALFPGRPLVVTEFGAASNGRNPTNAVGGLRYQATLLKQRIAQLRAARVAGMIVWTLRDFALRPDFHGGSISGSSPTVALSPGLNEKGLFTYGGRPKPAVAAVRRAFADAGAGNLR